MIQLLTASGARPWCLLQCAKMMAGQSYTGKVVWIIVDDGPEPSTLPAMPENFEVRVIRPEPFWQPGQNTQGRNLEIGLEQCSSDFPLLIIEDDDWYCPTWLEEVSKLLQTYEMVGEDRAFYYNVRVRRYFQHQNVNHSSLCSTATIGAATDHFRTLVGESAKKYIDIDLWGLFHGKKKLMEWKGRVIGLKGLPGRGGIGGGHQVNLPKYAFMDETGSKLSSLIGKDFSSIYLKQLPPN